MQKKLHRNAELAWKVSRYVFLKRLAEFPNKKLDHLLIIIQNVHFKTPNFSPLTKYIRRAVSNFYRTDIWAGFGPVGSTEKNGANYEQLLRTVFSCFHGQKTFFFK